MKNYEKINRNKQKQQHRRDKIKAHTEAFSNPSAYKVFTLIHLCDEPVPIKLDVLYNYILRETDGLSDCELSYLARCSDLLLMTVSSHNVNQARISLIKKYMPTTVIVYERKQKGIARGIAKIFGDIRICEASMLPGYLSKLETTNTQLCQTRPYMVPKEATLDGEFLYVEGFMRNGLVSDRVIISGTEEGVIQEIEVDGEILSGESLRVELDEASLARKITAETAEESKVAAFEEPFADEDDQCSTEEYELEDPSESALDPEYDLINRYADYRGILNMATCTFDDQQKPAYYEDLIFTKNQKYTQNSLKKCRSRIPRDKYVRMKIRLFRPINNTRVLVIFNVYELETRNTIWNYEFAHDTPLPKALIIDNGYRIFTTQCILTRNISHNIFSEDPTLSHGVVSFIGPFSLLPSVAHTILADGSLVRLYNGESKDRIFFDCVELRGKPIKIYKRYCVIRGMFHNKGQVDYFSSIRLATAAGSQGFIKKPLGTKGLFKAYFNQSLKHNETVTLSLYRRIFL